MKKIIFYYKVLERFIENMFNGTAQKRQEEHDRLLNERRSFKKEDFIEPEFKKCPYCAEEIKYAAIVCKHCGSNVEIKKSLTQKERLLEERDILLHGNRNKRQGLTVGDGVNAGCGMFIVLPLLIVLGFIILLFFAKGCS